MKSQRTKFSLKHCQDTATERGGKCLSNVYTNDREQMKWECDKGHRWETSYHSLKRGTWCKKCANGVHNIESCHAKARENDGVCLSEEYKNNYTLMKWKCSEGHEWETAFKMILRGTWCGKCATGYGKIEDLHIKAKENDGLCLSEKYTGAKSHYKWQCSEGHVWEATWKNVKIGGWCPGCLGRMDTIEDLHAKALERGGKCLSNVFCGGKDKYDWQCSNNHEWSTTWTLVKRNVWCLECHYDSLILTIEDCQKLAAEKGGLFLSKEYEGVKGKYEWQCHKGHKWITQYTVVKSGHWCPYCTKAKYTIEEIRSIVEEKGGKFLDGHYHKLSDHHNFECEKGHVWNTQLSNIMSGCWCPVCKKSKGEAKIEEALKSIGIKYITQKTFSSCTGTGDKLLQFDFFLPEYNVAIEYDGQQHFVLVDYFGGLEGFQKRIHHDAIKSNYCEQNGITLIRIAFDEDLETVLAERLERSFDEKFVMWVQISPEYENRVEAIFGKERYQTFKLGDVKK